MSCLRFQWNSVLFVTAALVAAGAGGFLAVRSTTPARVEAQAVPAPSQRDPKTAEDEKAIEKTQAAYVKAFNDGDAKAVAAFWTPDGEFVGVDGQVFKGRAAIAKEFAAFFAEAKGLNLEVSTDSLRFVSQDVALESGVARVTRHSDGATNVTDYHIVHTKRNGQWLLASVRESAHASTSNYDQLRPLEWLVGKWVAKSNGLTLEFSCEWTAKRNFMLRKYNLTNTDGTTKTGVQVIGWDPVAGAVISWIFDSDGGFGSEHWAKDGKRWIGEATSVTRDGAQAMATNILTQVDHDNFTWQSVGRTLDHVRLPDTAAIKATRVKARG
jgi:uncharacterized protein (TIGR02246 family)